MAGFDINALLPFIIIGAFILICLPMLIILINWLLHRKSTLLENPIDIHEAIVHKMKKAGRRNLRGVKSRSLWCSGDDNHPGFRYAKLYGIAYSQDCVVAMIYNGRKHLSKVSMAIFPMELTGDVFSENLAVNCRGFRFRSNYLIPIWPGHVYVEETKTYRKVTREDRLRWEKVTDEYFQFLVTNEEVEQLYEEDINGMIESMNVKAQATQVYRRDEHMANQDPNITNGVEDGTKAA